MFVLLDGGADVEVGGKAVHHYSRGGYFGELSLIQNAPRTATVRASCDTMCMVLDKPTFEAQGVGDFALLYVLHFIKSVPILGGMSDEDRERTTKALSIKYFHKREAIINQGERGDAMYFLASGSARVEIDGDTVHNYTTGAYFGELALLNNSPRAASIIASKNSVCFVLQRRDFERTGVHERDAYQPW